MSDLQTALNVLSAISGLVPEVGPILAAVNAGAPIVEKLIAGQAITDADLQAADAAAQAVNTQLDANPQQQA